MLTGRSNYHKVVETERNRIRLPNGMSLYYENLQRSEQGFEFQSNRKQVYTYGGKITENIVQALSRIVVTDALIRIAYKRKDLHVCLTVHDEIVCVGPAEAADERMQDIIDLMCIPPSWAEDLPLAAEGGYDSGYSK
jgi:DNA polymerase